MFKIDCRQVHAMPLICCPVVHTQAFDNGADHPKLQSLKDARDQEARIAKGEGGSGLLSSKTPKQATAMEEYRQRCEL